MSNAEWNSPVPSTSWACFPKVTAIYSWVHILTDIYLCRYQHPSLYPTERHSIVYSSSLFQITQVRAFSQIVEYLLKFNWKWIIRYVKSDLNLHSYRNLNNLLDWVVSNGSSKAKAIKKIPKPEWFNISRRLERIGKNGVCSFRLPLVGGWLSRQTRDFQCQDLLCGRFPKRAALGWMLSEAFISFRMLYLFSPTIKETLILAIWRRI